MSKRNEKRKTDERIEKESNALTAKMFWVITPLLLVSLAVKLICRVPWYVFALEILCLVASGVYVLVQELRKGILFVGKKDVALTEIHNGILTKAFMVDLWLLVLGEFIYVYAVEEYLWWVVSYLAVWMIPGLVITIVSIKKGWMVWGGKKQEESGKKRLIKTMIVVGPLYGLITNFKMLYHDGAFHAEGILWILGDAAMFGVIMYLFFVIAAKASGKKADERLEQEVGNEE